MRLNAVKVRRESVKGDDKKLLMKLFKSKETETMSDIVVFFFFTLKFSTFVFLCLFLYTIKKY